MRRLAIVTGAAGGLGKAFAAECAARGLDLLVTDMNGARLETLAEGIERLQGTKVHRLVCDLTDTEARRAFWEYARSLGPRLRYLVNVAGVDFEGPFAERAVEELEAIVRLNVESVVAMTRMALGQRSPTEPLSIINVSSLAGFYPMPVKAVYAASKRFLLDFSRALDAELRRSGVTVMALCPAGLPTHPAVIRAIEAQGLAGQLTTSNVGAVAAASLDRATAGQRVYIPGLINQVLGLVEGALPPSLVASLIGRRWGKLSLSATG